MENGTGDTKRVLVTGASGFVGGHVVAALVARGLKTRCLVRKTSRLDFIGQPTPEIAFGDVTQPATLEQALGGVDAVVHCAGLTRARSAAEYLRVNADGCENLYQACLAHKGALRRIVHISSLAALGPASDALPVDESRPREPVSDYGRSKLAGHQVAESYASRLPMAILIPPAVYGPGDRDFLKYFRLVRRGLSIVIGRTPRVISLVYATDLAAAVVACLEKESAAGRQYLVEDGKPRTWEEIAAGISRSTGRSPRTLRVTPGVAMALAAVAEFGARCAGKATLFSRDKMREFLQPAWTCTSDRIRSELGFVPKYPLEQGLDETYRWYMEHGWL